MTSKTLTQWWQESLSEHPDTEYRYDAINTPLEVGDKVALLEHDHKSTERRVITVGYVTGFTNQRVKVKLADGKETLRKSKNIIAAKQ